MWRGRTEAGCPVPTAQWSDNAGRSLLNSQQTSQPTGLQPGEVLGQTALAEDAMVRGMNQSITRHAL